MRAARRAIGISRSVVAAAVLLTGACSGGGGSPSTTSSSQSQKPVEGGTMRLGLGGPVQPDPARANLASPAEMMVLDLLHDGLTRLGEDGTPAPAIAKSWKPDAALKTWMFTLDGKAKFTSGHAVTAADVVASLEHVAKGGDTSLAALRLESISGFRAFVDGTAPHLAGLAAPTPKTVQIALDTPMSVLPVILASPLFGIVDVASLKTATAKDGSLGHLDLTGGWVVASAERNDVQLKRRGKSAVHLDAVDLRSYANANRAYDAFDAGHVDWAPVPVERYGNAIDDHGDAAFTPFHAELFFGMRVTSPSLSNVVLRQAIAAAIDRKAIVRAVYPDLAAPLATVVPDGVPGYDPDRCAECGHDPKRARTLLAGAYADGKIPTVAIDFDESPAQESMARIVAKDLKSVGIPSQLRPKTLEEYKRFVVSGAQELFSFGWIGGYSSPDAYLAPLFGSAANDNLTGYGVGSVDAALAGARATTDPAKAAKHWANVERRVLGDAVVVPIAQFRTQAVLGTRVKGFEAAVDGSVDWASVWVADGA